MNAQIDEFASRHLPARRSIREIAAVFLEFGSEMFAGLGGRSGATRIETFHDLGELRPNMSLTGFYSLRNEDMFYWVLLNGIHRTAPDETLQLEFEAQLTRAERPIFQADAARTITGADSLTRSDEPLSSVRIRFDEKFRETLDGVFDKLAVSLASSGPSAAVF